MMSNKDLLFVMLDAAIKEKKVTNFADKVRGIPVDYTCTEELLIIEFEPTYVSPEATYEMGVINRYEINVKKYCKIAPSKTVFAEKTQEFYFESVDGDYFVIIFGC